MTDLADWAARWMAANPELAIAYILAVFVFLYSLIIVRLVQ